VRHRYERFDGPASRARSPARRSARQPILAIADSYDTMLTARAYREPSSAADALAELQRCAGREFDPALIRLFTTLLGEH